MKTTVLWLFASFATLSAAPAAAQEGESAPHQRVLALHRMELRPYGGWAAVPNSVTGAFVGADVDFRLSRLLALGGDLAWYAPFERSAGEHPSYPLNETRWSVDLDVHIVPWPASARTGDAAGAFEPYLLGGVGALASRPIAVVDPGVRTFDSNTLATFCVGAGMRLFVAERVAVTLEVRDLMYFERLENGQIASGPSLGQGPQGTAFGPLDPSTWYSPTSHFTNAIQARVGASFFLLGG
jgi:hypothetical protein